ncbi:MAG: CoA transferase, partial [Chloroflexi bacterium]|nr:CoA transferase [Chloroflexota bacterium]
ESAPHGAYPCRGKDRWCVLSTSSDQEWRRLCQIMGKPELADDERFATLSARKQNEDDLDRIVGTWTANFDAQDVVEKLQSAGLKSAPVNTMADLFSDPQLRHRGFWHELEHPEMGRHHYEDSPFQLSKTPSQVTKPAPCLGEHNEHFYKKLLGIPADEYGELVASGVIN